MATEATNKANETQAVDKKKAVVCACCLTFFPVVYLIGTTIKGFLG